MKMGPFIYIFTDFGEIKIRGFLLKILKNTILFNVLSRVICDNMGVY